MVLATIAKSGSFGEKCYAKNAKKHLTKKWQTCNGNKQTYVELSRECQNKTDAIEDKTMATLRLKRKA